MTTEPKDWRGQPVTKPERDSDRVTVWEIEPAPTRHYDCLVARGYQDAKHAAELVLESLMDDPMNEDELRNGGVTVKISLKTMTVAEIEELENDN